MSELNATVQEIRSQWKPHKERLARSRSDHPTSVRFHRACSWLEQAEKRDATPDADLILVQQWIALNALYGTWDESNREPTPDRQAWRTFFERILSIDAAGHLRQPLIEHKQLVLTILQNAYLNRHFWQGPSPEANRRSRNASRKAASWYVEERWIVIIEQLAERIYLLRCQLIHGAATFGSRLNRDAIRHCTRMMELLIPAILRVWVDYGADEDWGELCYPPINTRVRQGSQPK